ncbi:hypothetical protein G6M89_00670 [Natronolimnobius sp. AArcel1]|uniref:hypothetical protein n=1 Tax=Natronolimnobius sp. AArcel1 TaxID=1679093 RepID=UPI0013EC7E30|nr:hypothetical protein [Natronolimnobius sp. AArcel1]NGM67532.1 hypothetical protein [Natronolimnobius sp. AArcel1]
MTGSDLRSFVSRTTALISATPPSTGRETRAWIVDPLLETLGWDRYAASTITDTAVEDAHLEYILAVESTPALFVAVEPYGRDLSEQRARTLLEAMAWTGVDRALYTNGHSVAFFAGTTDADRLLCPLTSLPDHESSLEHYTRAAASKRLETDTADAVARRLAVNRSSVTESITDELVTVGGETYRDEFETAADRLLDRLVVSFADNDAERFEPDSDDVALEFTDSSQEHPQTDSAAVSRDPTEDELSGGSVDETAPTANTDSDVIEGENTAETSSNESATEPEPSEPATDSTDEDANTDETKSDPDTEYVARFFNDRGSIGAVGHSQSEQALVSVADYLFERGLSGITVPWSPDDDSVPTLLNDNPQRATGDPMASPRELSNGLTLETAGDAESHARIAEALAARAGLRVMLTGDWESPE